MVETVWAAACPKCTSKNKSHNPAFNSVRKHDKKGPAGPFFHVVGSKDPSFLLRQPTERNYVRSRRIWRSAHRDLTIRKNGGSIILTGFCIRPRLSLRHSGIRSLRPAERCDVASGPTSQHCLNSKSWDSLDLIGVTRTKKA